MKQFNYTITDPVGIHARPAGLLVKEVTKYGCSVTVTKNGKTVDAKKIIALMSLGVKQGEEITVSVEGEGEEEASLAIEEYMKTIL